MGPRLGAGMAGGQDLWIGKSELRNGFLGSRLAAIRSVGEDLDAARSRLDRGDGPALQPRGRRHEGRPDASGDGTGQTEEHQREQRAGSAGEDLRRVVETWQPGRHDAADESERDQSDGGSHQGNPPEQLPAIEVPQSRAPGERVEVYEKSAVVTARGHGWGSCSSRSYQVTL